jgi:hypothetical protein
MPVASGASREVAGSLLRSCWKLLKKLLDPHSTLHSPPIHTSHSTLHQSTLHQSTLHTPLSTNPHFTLKTPHPTLHTPLHHFTQLHQSQCFDGSKFRDCAGRGQDFLQWGVGVKFIYGEAKRYFFNFNIQDRNSCITSQGKKVVKGDCKSAGALKWGLNEGQLTASNGKFCVSRLADETAVLSKTSEENCEFIAMEVPSVYTDEQIAGMLKNPNLSEEERDLLMEAVQKRQLTR